MLSRTAVSSLALLFLATFLLANCAISAETPATLPLTPPPIAPQAARFGPLADPPASPLTTTIAVTASLVLTPAPGLSITVELAATPTLSATTALIRAVIVTPTAAAILPTVTPTPAAPILLPTPTPTLLSTTVPSVTLPTAPSAASAPVATVTVTLAPTVTPTLPITEDAVALPSSIITTSVPLPTSYQAQGSFASQTVYTDSTISQQQGSFTIKQATAPNAYGANQQYTLRTQRATGTADEINVYQIDDYIAVSYTGGDWMLVRRDQGSNVVRAIQPITDLAVLFPRIIHQAEFVRQEEIAGTSALRYRIDDPAGQGARLIQSLLALTGKIRSLKLEVWIAVPGGYVVAYNFQVELSEARVLNAAGNEVRADQAVTWTYQLTPSAQPQPIAWPENAPTPDAFPVPGFALGTFPMPPNTTLLALVGGVPDLISTLTPVELDSFYRTELLALGWIVEGEGGLLRCTKEGASFQLLISDDEAMGGTRISVLAE